MRELKTDPPASGFGARDPRPTAEAVGSGERRSGTGGLGGWPGGLDNPIPHHSNFTNWKCIFLLFFTKCKIEANEYHKGTNNNSNNNIKQRKR